MALNMWIKHDECLALSDYNSNLKVGQLVGLRTHGVIVEQRCLQAAHESYDSSLLLLLLLSP